MGASIRPVSPSARLFSVLGVNLLLVAALLATGAISGSLGLLAEALDCLADAVAAGIAVVAELWAGGREPDHEPAARGSQGSPPSPPSPSPPSRAPAIAAVVNSAWMVLSSAAVAADSSYRLVTGAPSVDGLAMFAAGAATAVVLGTAAFLAADGPMSLNLKAVLVDTAGDAIAAGGVAVAGAVIALTHGTYWLDPVIALVVSGAVAVRAGTVLRAAVAAVGAAGPGAAGQPCPQGCTGAGPSDGGDPNGVGDPNTAASPNTVASPSRADPSPNPPEP